MRQCWQTPVVFLDDCLSSSWLKTMSTLNPGRDRYQNNAAKTRLSVHRQAAMTKRFVRLPNETLIYTNSLHVPPLLLPQVLITRTHGRPSLTTGRGNEERSEVSGEVCLLMRWIRLGRRQSLAANCGQTGRDGWPNLRAPLTLNHTNLDCK